VDRIEERGSLRVMIIKTEKGKVNKKGSSSKIKTVEYSISKSNSFSAGKGDFVEIGDQLSDGNLDLKELFKFRGREDVERYVVSEIQKIYFSEGASINDKHIEIIVRQMFSRVKIKDSGDAPDLVAGEIIEKDRLVDINKQLKKDGQQPAKAQQLLLGITQVALSSESFLSAASFQDTARVLVRASIEGRVDTLRGLKENVIIGRLIPNGKIGEDDKGSNDDENIDDDSGSDESLLSKDVPGESVDGPVNIG